MKRIETITQSMGNIGDEALVFAASLSRLNGALGAMIKHATELAVEGARQWYAIVRLTGVTIDEIEPLLSHGWTLPNLKRFYLRWGRLPRL